MIHQFSGEHAWLSNFQPCKIIYREIEYNTVENAYVAAKTFNRSDRIKIAAMTPSEAKKFGRTLKLREDWEKVKLKVMYDLLIQKFEKGSYLGNKLEATGNEELVEGNYWKDTFWGVCEGKGHNHLGKLLMQIRKSLQDQSNE